MKTFIQPFFISLIALLACSGLHGQNVPSTGKAYYFQQMDNRNGLSNSAVNVVFQDKDQLVWVGTWDGLNLYDGTDFRVFNYNNEGRNSSIGNNVIQDIKEDKAGNIWISTIGGITRFNKESGSFYRYFYNSTAKNRILEKEFELIPDGAGGMLCYSRTSGLSRFDKTANKFQKIKTSAELSGITRSGSGTSGLLWFLKNNGELLAARLHKDSLEIVHVTERGKGIDNFFAVNNRIFFQDKKNALFEIDSKFNQQQIMGDFNAIRSICFYQDHYLVAWEAQGIGVFNAGLIPVDSMKNEVRQLSGTKVTDLFAAQDQVLWLGTDGNGVIKIHPRINHFGLVAAAGKIALDKPVRAFAEVNGNLWIGTKGKGIVRMNGTALNAPDGLENNAVYALKKSTVQPFLFIGTDAKGISIYHLQKQKIIRWSDVKHTAGLPSFGSVYAILEDPDSSLWLGTSGSGLVHLRLAENEDGDISVTRFKQYLSGAHNGPANDIIYALASGSDGRLWIACRYGGLSVLDKQTGSFKTFKAFGYTNSLSNNDVLSLYLDRKKRIWIGTSYGLNYLTHAESLKENGLFKKYTMEDGLPNNTIHAIEEAADGQIWVSTNKGLARLNPDNNAIASFRESDGLQSNEFSDGAVWKSPSGHLYFGGIYGFNYFLPKQITGNAVQPNLLVSGIQMGGKNVESDGENRLQVVTAMQKPLHEYTLERKSNFFRLVLKSMSFLNPAKNEFAYKLQGLDKDWNYSGASGNITYNNVPPGNYILMVRWSNGEGLWTNGVGLFKLKVEQYFWITYPALLLYLLVLLTAGYAFWVYRKNKLKMRYNLQLENMLRKKDEEAHQARLNFFTNIAHEIQTPLTLIMGSVEYLNRQNNYFLSMIHQHTARLSYLVQQLLEFRKAEAGYLKKEEDYVDVSKMLESLSALFVGEGIKHKKQYERQVEEGMAGYIDKDKFEKVLFNLLSNAFKHSGNGSFIRFHAVYNASGPSVEVKVSNTGCTLDDGEIEQIFSKFYVRNDRSDKKFSTGIGLAFTRELVNLMGAEIAVNKEGDRIDFIVQVPLPATTVTVRENEVVTSEPSYLYKSLIKSHEVPEVLSVHEENKNSLIKNLQQSLEYSILVVEDEPELRFLIRNVLAEEYIVYEAGSGNEALSQIKMNKPDLIISDVMMPDMDGLTLCRIVKQTPAMEQIPFVILSAKGTEENKAEGYEVGADAYIPKPFQINYLHVRIRKLLEYRARMRNLIKDQHITTQFMDADIAESDKKFLEALLKAIEENLNEPELNAAVLEDALSISKMQLYRKLKSLAGMTPAEFIKRIRLKHAADMLLSSKYNVSEIFYRTGFNNKSYFFREFKKIYHCAPNEYRQLQYKENSPAL